MSDDIVHAFFDALAEGRIDDWMALLGHDVAADTPFAPADQPRRFEGADAIRARFGDARLRMRALEFYDREIHQTVDGPTVATCRSRGELGDGGIYENSYCWLFTIEAGVITHWVEYFDPLQLPGRR